MNKLYLVAKRVVIITFPRYFFECTSKIGQAPRFSY